MSDIDSEFHNIEDVAEIRRLRAALERIKAYPVGTFRPLEDECAIWRIANDALQPEPQSSAQTPKA